MASITPFEFDGNKVRLILRNDEPWFIAKDLCAILGIQNIRQNLSNLDEDEKDTVCLKDGTPGNPNTAIVSESGMYALVLSSRKSEAKPFRKWITSEVLPSIRKTGSYGADEPFFWVRLKIYIRQNAPNVPDGYFTIFRECLDLVSDLEAIGYILPANAIPDISVGKCWANYLKAENIPHDSVPYNHTYPDDVRGDKTCRAYPETLLPLFRQWFRSTYKPVKLPDYIERRHREILPGVVKLLGLNPTSVKKALKEPIGVSQLRLF